MLAMTINKIKKTHDFRVSLLLSEILGLSYLDTVFYISVIRCHKRQFSVRFCR